MSSTKYRRSSNQDFQKRHKSYWNHQDPPKYHHYKHHSTPFPTLTQYLQEHSKKSNLIEFADVKIDEITLETFSTSIDKIISCLNETKENSLIKVNKEAVIHLIHKGFTYYKSAPVINLLITMKNCKESQKIEVKNCDFDDMIIYYLKQICANFEKYEDFLDSMILLTTYLTKNIIKNNLTEEDTSNKDKDKEKEKDKEKDKSKSQAQNNATNTTINFIDTLYKYLYKACADEIFCLYPILSTILSILCKTNTYPACEIFLNLILLYKINFSTSAINSYIDFLCRNNSLEQCHELLCYLVKYKPEYSLPENVSEFLKEKYGENHLSKEKEEINQIIKKEKTEKAEKDNNFKLNCEKNLILYGINIVSFGIFLKYLCKNDFLELALFYYEQLNKNNILKDEVIYNLLLNGCSKKLDIKNLHKIYMDMIDKKISPNLITFNTIIDAFIRNKNTEKAFGIFNSMIKEKINPDNFTLSTLFKGINKPEHYKYLIQGVEIINKNIYPVDIILINVLLDACIKLKDKKNFCEIFDNIINKKYKNISPDLITYNTFIKGCSKFKLYDKVEYAFNHLIIHTKETNIIPNDVTFNTLIDVYVSQKNMEKVLGVINLMQFYKIFPDNYTYTTIIKGLNKNSLPKCTSSINSSLNQATVLPQKSSITELDLAFQLFNHVRNMSKPDEILYNCIMDACLRFNKIDKMLEIYNEMIKNGIKPSSITCGIVIKAYGMKGDLNSALNIYYKMKQEKIEISNITYGCLINACIKNNDLNKAFELYESLKKESYEMNTILYTTLIKAYTKQKDINKVIEIFNTMKQSKNSKPNIITYNSIIDCCIKCDKFNLAYDYFKEMLYDINNNTENSIRPDIVTFSTLIKGEINNKCFGNARKLMQKLLEYNYIKLDCVLLNTLLDGCDKCKCYEEALDIFNIFKNKNIACNMMTYSILMKICGKLNDFENSYKLLNEMKENHINFNLIIMTCYVKTCLNTNHVVEGINTFKEMTKYNIYPDNIAYTTIISGIINNLEICDFSDELINFVKKSIEDGININKNLYIKSYYYLTLLGHKDKADALTEYFKEKNVMNNSIIMNSTPSCVVSENDKDNSNDKEKKINSNGEKSNSSDKSNNSNNSNESTNTKTINSSITNFNAPLNYSYLSTLNALNMCFNQKFGMDSNNKSVDLHYKETPLKDIFENNKSYPFVYKSREKEPKDENNNEESSKCKSEEA